MTSPVLFRIAAFAFVALALIATAFDLTREAEGPPSAVAPAKPQNPKTEVLRRCQTLGTSAATDATCLRSWAEERARFLKIYPRSDRFEPAKPENAS